MLVSTVHPEPFPPGVEDRLGDFAGLVAQALANAETREELAASRARLVQASDAEHRRLERNLHDGAQQRLVAAPPVDQGMVATGEHLRDVEPAPGTGLGVAGAFEQPVGEAVLLVAGLVAQHAGD